MGKFEVGQRIVLTNYLGTVEGLKNGVVGMLSAKNSDLDIFFAKFDGFYGEIPVYPGEMELAPAEPAQPAAPARAEGGADELATLKRALELGTAELRRYVEGNGFTWCEDEDTVFNVTTALGLMGGTIEAQRAETERLQRELAAAREALKPLAGLWQGWQWYCAQDDQPQPNIIEWLKAYHTRQNVAQWLREAFDALQARRGAE